MRHTEFLLVVATIYLSQDMTPTFRRIAGTTLLVCAIIAGFLE